jgi:hypothetical protein
VNALLIQSPRVDFAKFLNTCEKLLPHRPAAKSDADPRRLSETERWLSCLAGFRDADEIESDVARHASFSMLVWAPHEHLKEFVELCGMPFVTSHTFNFAFTAAVITGPLDRWSSLEIDRPHLQPLIEAIEREFKLAGVPL